MKDIHRILRDAIVSAGLFAAALAAKSLIDYTRTGPAIRQQIEAHYSGFALASVAVLALAAFAIAFVMALSGRLVAAAWFPDRARNMPFGILSALAGIGTFSALAFAWTLLERPGLIVASWLYDVRHLVTAWFFVDHRAVVLAAVGVAVLLAASFVRFAWRCRQEEQPFGLLLPVLTAVVLVLAVADPLGYEPSPERKNTGVHAGGRVDRRPLNIVMIGSDTLRADRLGVMGYARGLTPAIDRLARQGAWFTDMYVPIGRTAPSMAAMLTGAWPRRNGVTSNFIPDVARNLPVPALPMVLARHGYRTAAVGDWAASDLGKIRFGFDHLTTAPDQWNIKYLIRQGPKDLRLYLSLFTQNAWARHLLPQIYYLAGRPLTTEVGRQARRVLDDLAHGEQPFFLFTFIATTHPPFSVEYPYYTRFSGPDYRGRSKFSMTDVFTPEAIAKAQQKGAEAFDVQQIIDLYDGCVVRFDDEVRRILDFMRARGLLENTIVVIFSDHGTDLFEKGTWGQGNSVLGKDPSNHIPFVVLDPLGRLKGRIDATARSIDIAPTLLELAGIDPGELGTDGRSLLPMAAGREPRPRAAYLATGAWLARVQGMAEDHLSVPPLLELLEIRDYDSGTISLSEAGARRIEQARDRAVRWGHWKLVRIPLEGGGVRRALYDLQAGDDADVSGSHPRVTACLGAVLDRWAETGEAETWPECPTR